ncbi:hypothetical protein ACWES4_33570, partial [Streptomyces sp. NPDC004011]
GVGAGAPGAAFWACRTGVEVVGGSGAAGLPAEPARAGRAVGALAGSEHSSGRPEEFRRLLAPDEGDRSAAALLRHPDLLAPVTALHHAELLDRLTTGPALAA